MLYGWPGALIARFAAINILNDSAFAGPYLRTLHRKGGHSRSHSNCCCFPSQGARCFRRLSRRGFLNIFTPRYAMQTIGRRRDSRCLHGDLPWLARSAIIQRRAYE
jgi:hypothetical protein